MSDCKVLKEIKQKIDAGVSPEDAIPYSIACATLGEYIDVLYYALQVVPECRRKQEIQRKYDEVISIVRGTEG